MASTTRSKFGYLSYNRMLAKISTGELDAYDINFAPDTKECYIISPDLTPWSVKSKVYTFNSVDQATRILNENVDTYPGQIVAIKANDKFVGYIVNETKDGYVVDSLIDSSEGIDYNNLGNRPIINIEGTLSAPIVADELDPGIYSFSGSYKISQKLETIFNSNKPTLFLIEKDATTEPEITYVRKISGKEIILYTVSDSVTQESLITEKFLLDNNYATKEDVNSAIAALDIFTKQDAQVYIEDLLKSSSLLEDTVAEQVNHVLDEKMNEATNEDIQSLFQSEEA